MKVYLGLLALMFGLALASGIHYYRHRTPSLPAGDLNDAIASTKQAFVKGRPSVLEFYPGDVAQKRNANELLLPENALPQTQFYNYAEIRRLYQYARTCGFRPTFAGHDREGRKASLRKAVTWHRFLCGKTSSLPSHFFETPPYLHPSGASYVRLAVETARPEFSEVDWIRRHLDYLHVSELAKLPASIRLSGLESLLAHLSRPELAALAKGAAVIQGSRYTLLLAKESTELGMGRKYGVFPTSQWLDYLAASPFAVIVENGSETERTYCLFREGNLCWQYNRRRLVKENRLYAVVSIFSFSLLVATLLFVAWQKLRAAKRDEEARIFVLQTLTHEIRTPAATMQVCLERFRRDFDKLPESAQTDFLRMCDEMQRLNRVLEASHQYLQSQKGKLMRFHYATVESVNEFFECLLDGYGDRVSLQRLETDHPFRMDCYWVGLCVKNLVENAIRHGHPPVAVTLSPHRSWLKITVADGGKVSHYDFRQMTQEFSRSRTSNGLGLGLTIVSKIVKLMEGRLIFSPAPTTFSILLRNPG